MPYVVDEIKRCGLTCSPNFEAPRRKSEQEISPPTANHSADHNAFVPTLANDFSFCLPRPSCLRIISLSKFHTAFISRFHVCLPPQTFVFSDFLRTLFLSLHSFSTLASFVSIPLRTLFAKQKPGVGVPSATTSALSAPARYHLPLLSPSHVFKALTISLPHTRSIWRPVIFKHLQYPFFFNHRLFHIYTKPRGCGGKLWLTSQLISLVRSPVAAASSEESKNSIVTNETLH